MSKQLEIQLNLPNMTVPTKQYRKLSRKELLRLRDEEIRKEFHHLTSEKHLDMEYVIHEKLQTKYFVDPDTIFMIVRGTYKRGYHK
jgi:hypothetical protein